MLGAVSDGGGGGGRGSGRSGTREVGCLLVVVGLRRGGEGRSHATLRVDF